MKAVEILLLCLLATLGGTCAFGTQDPLFSLQKDYLGVSGYPRMVGTALVTLCMLRMLWLLSTRGVVDQTITTTGSPKILLPMGLAVAYVFGISYIGFIICSFIYLFLMPFMLDSKDKKPMMWKHLVYSTIVTCVIYAFFRIFKIYLPSALLF